MRMEFSNPIDKSLLYSSGKEHIIIYTISYTSTESGHSFNEVLFYGNEWSLLSFEMLLFLVIDFAGRNYVLAAVVTYIISKVQLILSLLNLYFMYCRYFTL